MRTGIVISSFFLLVTFFHACLVSLMYLLDSFFFGSSNGFGHYSAKTMIIYFIMFLTCLLILRKSNAISDWLTEKAVNTDNISITISYQTIFMIILISYSFFEIVSLLPTVLSAIFDNFKSKINGGLMDVFAEQDDINWFSLVIKIAVYTSIIFLAKRISGWFNWSIERTPEHLKFVNEDINNKRDITDDQP